MAKILLITDRAPDQRDWPSLWFWQIARRLAESQHDVQVATSARVEENPYAHPRLHVFTPPVQKGLMALAHWGTLLWTQRPDVIHLFIPQAPEQLSLAHAWSWIPAERAMLRDTVLACTTFGPADLLAEEHESLGLKLWFSSSDLVFVSDELSQRWLSSHSQTQRRTVQVVPPPLPPQLTTSGPHWLEKWSEPFVLIPAAPGECGPEAEVLEGVAQILAERPHWHAVFVTDKIYSPLKRAKWLELSRDLKIEQQVVFVNDMRPDQFSRLVGMAQLLLLAPVQKLEVLVQAALMEGWRHSSSVLWKSAQKEWLEKRVGAGFDLPVCTALPSSWVERALLEISLPRGHALSPVGEFADSANLLTRAYAKALRLAEDASNPYT